MSKVEVRHYAEKKGHYFHAERVTDEGYVEAAKKGGPYATPAERDKAAKAAELELAPKDESKKAESKKADK